ncbi:Gfo/Idh/MocA family protein [Flindersiella endophytica]
MRVVLAGFGGLGRQDHQTAMYAPALRAHPGFEIAGVVALTDAEHDRAAAVAQDLDVPRFPGLDSALADADAAVVCGEPGLREDVVGEVISAGRHVLADKPLALSAGRVAGLAEVAAKQPQVVVAVAHHLRFHPMLRAAATAIAGGKVGLPWNVQADFLVAGGDPIPAGELHNFGCYPVDIVLALTGLDVLRVHAIAPGSQDLAVLMLDHEYGLTSTIAFGRTVARATVDPGGLAVHRYRVSGSHGVADIDATKPALLVETGEQQRRRYLGDSTVTLMLDDWLAAVHAGRPAAAGLPQALAVARVLDAAQLSLRHKHPVEVSR